MVGRRFWETPFWAGLPDMQRGWPGRLAEAARLEGPMLSLDRYRAAGGEIRTADAAVTAVKDRSGAVRFFVVQATDVTERVRAEAALRGSEERFRLMADAVPQIVWITDAGDWPSHEPADPDDPFRRPEPHRRNGGVRIQR